MMRKKSRSMDTLLVNTGCPSVPPCEKKENISITKLAASAGNIALSFRGAERKARWARAKGRHARPRPLKTVNSPRPLSNQWLFNGIERTNI
jgi:hypothetical protein